MIIDTTKMEDYDITKMPLGDKFIIIFDDGTIGVGALQDCGRRGIELVPSNVDQPYDEGGECYFTANPLKMSKFIC